MDKILFPLRDNLYNIELSKSTKSFGYSNNGNYICKMKFLDKLGIPQVEIEGSEKQFIHFLCLMMDITENYIDNFIINFTAGVFDYIIYVSRLVTGVYPSDQDDIITLQIFQDNIQGRISRIYIEFQEDENLMLYLYELLHDIPNFGDIRDSIITELIDEYTLDKIRR